MSKYAKQDAMIQLYERYTDVALALALEGKISVQDDEKAHTLFTEGKEEQLSKLYHRRKRELHKPIKFLEPEKALKNFKPKPVKKNSDDPSLLQQTIAFLKKTKGTRLYAQARREGK